MNMLGVYMAPDGNTRDHVRYLRSKAEQWATNMRQASRNNKQEVWLALHCTIPFVLCYSLPAVTLTADECRYHGTHKSHRIISIWNIIYGSNTH
jgi:hypothetical protein